MTRMLEDFEAPLPRSESGEGENLTVVEVLSNGHVVITDGERNASYEPRDGIPLGVDDLRIVPGNVEAGYFTEANVVTLTDRDSTKLYDPVGYEEAYKN
jgi:hypothetical protein